MFYWHDDDNIVPPIDIDDKTLDTNKNVRYFVFTFIIKVLLSI